MTNAFKSTRGLMLAGLFVIVITAVAWQKDDTKNKSDSFNKQSAGDTSIPKQHNYNKDAYKLKGLDEAMKQLDIEMKNLDMQLKDLDIEISNNVKEALAGIDFEKIGKEVAAELKKVDFEKINIEVTQSLKEAQEEIKKIDMQQLQNEIKEMHLKLNSSELKQEIEDAMKGAKKEIEKAKQELQDLKQFTDTLEKDGLIDKKTGYNVEWKKDGDLIINGKIQPKEIADKYSRYYKKDGYKIQMRANDNDLETDNL